MTPRPHGSAPHGAPEALAAFGASSAPAPLAIDAPLFFVVELEVYQPGGRTIVYDRGHGAAPHGALSASAQLLESTDTIRASDMGYRGRDTDAGGMRVFPPILQSAFEIDRSLPLAPGSAAQRSYGAVRLDNLGRRFDAFAAARNSDNRPVRILAGQKGWDRARGLRTDPPFAELRPFFGGVGLPWQLGEKELTVPLADPGAWLDRPVQSSLYLGSGGYEGTAALAGKPRPMARGGAYGNPIRDVPLVAVDPVALIYQWTDGVGTVTTLYEGGAAVFAYDGDVADLYAGAAPAAGHFRTCNARGVLQLGSKPVRQLSADVTGSFTLSGLVNTPAGIARAMLTEDMALPAAVLDLASFDAAASAYPYLAGYHVPAEPVQGSTLAGEILDSINARLGSTRSGLLRVSVLGALPSGTVPVATLTTANVIDVVPQPLPPALDPPPYRWRIGYGRTWLTQTSDLNGSISAERQQALATSSRYGAWFGAAVRTAWRRPNDPAPVETILLAQADAEAVAARLGAMFAGRPGSYAVTVPIAVAAGIDLDSAILLQWPLADLVRGRMARVVGEQVRSVDAQVTLTVLAA